ncbi:ribonuclease P protein subunit p38-like isoform X1 [Dendronephthya gigantea]|uniref:ribonuclease P protein subunit p38-like isoform X1 n=1 Tax=Dendronephthya gigantea TaxID=151771 RepID=UPI00106D01A4|nr:ribonuclease P protein subunit p38-like isoform X1 [Dendronephthya gigantea]
MYTQHITKQAKTKKKPGVKNFLSSPYSLTRPKLDKGDNKNILDGIISVFPPGGIKREKPKDVSQGESQFVSWELAKNSLVFGVNSVTKSLEKDNLMLVLVCGSTKPAILSNHLMLLSATRSTPCCAVFGLSEVMAPLLGLKTVAACGFKKNITANILKDLMEYIVCKIPPLPEQYLEVWNNNGHEISDISRDIRENKMQGGVNRNVSNLPSQPS